MIAPQKQHAFRWLDLATFGTLGVGASAVALYVTVQGEELSAVSFVLLWLVALSFVALYVALVAWRAQYLAAFSFTTDDGIMIDFGVGQSSYMVSRADIEAEIARTILLYGPYFPYARDLLRASTVYIRFQPGPFPHPQDYQKKLMGYVVANGDIAHVAYVGATQPIKQTALSHELGHIILGRALGNWDCTKHHAFMQEHKLD